MAIHAKRGRVFTVKQMTESDGHKMPADTLLVDECAARDFCRTFLLAYPACPRILQCVARKKYAKDNNAAKWQGPGLVILERVVLYFDQGQASEDAFIRELRKIQLLANAGMYTFKNSPQTICLDWMVLYLTAYPLDEDDAADAFVNKVLEIRQDQRRAYVNEKVHDGMSHILSKVKTILHKHPCRKCKWLKLDVDTKNPVLIAQLQTALHGATIVMAVETRGGYHVILEKGPCCQELYAMAKRVNRGVSQEEQWITIESSSGPMLAIPGTNQGAFAAKLATQEWRQCVQTCLGPGEKKEL